MQFVCPLVAECSNTSLESENEKFVHLSMFQVTVIGFTLGIPDVIIGITFLAAGTSVPDCMASLIVARQGKPAREEARNRIKAKRTWRRGGDDVWVG